MLKVVIGVLVVALGGRPFGEGVVKSFFDRGGVAWDINGDGKTNAEYTFNQLTSLLDTKQFVRSKPAQTGNLFHTATQDDWTSDTSGVEYHHIFGVQKLPGTIGKVVAETIKRCEPQKGCIETNRYNYEKVFGDGTVPKLSAERKAVAGNLNARQAKMHPFVANTYDDNGSVEHTGLTQNPKVWDTILSALQATPQQSARHTQVSKPVMQKASFKQQTTQEQSDSDQPLQIKGEEGYYLSISGVERIFVTDAHGNSNSQIEGTSFARLVPSVDILRGGDKSFQLNFPAELLPEDNFTITFRESGEPILLEIVRGVGNAPEALVESIKYLDLNLPAGVTAQIKVTPEGVENLHYDGDGDGIFESTVEPTASVKGDLAKDVSGPLVTFSEKVQGTKRLVSVTTEDEAGVKSVRYSLDGTRYQPYTRPLLINPAQNPAIYIIADDNLANRASSTYRPLVLMTAVIRDVSTNEIIVTTTVRNDSDAYVADVITNFVLNAAKLNNKPTTTTLPISINVVPAGETATVTLRFPATTAKSGTKATLAGSGTSHGTAFSGAIPVTVP